MCYNVLRARILYYYNPSYSKKVSLLKVGCYYYLLYLPVISVKEKMHLYRPTVHTKARQASSLNF